MWVKLPWPFSELYVMCRIKTGARCPTQLSKQYDSTNSPSLLGSNDDMEAYEHGLESHDAKVFDTVN